MAHAAEEQAQHNLGKGVGHNMVSHAGEPPSNQILPKEPIGTGPVTEYYEVALCEAGERGQLLVKDIQKSFEPDFTFHEGLDPDKYYAMAKRRVEVKDSALIMGKWSDPNVWRKPTVAHGYEPRRSSASRWSRLKFWRRVAWEW